MKGLLIKDLLLVKNQGNTLLLFAACGLVMSVTMGGDLVTGYMAILGAMLTMGTLSYDEFEGGYTYLFTLPVTRRMYVREKYLFCIGGAAVGTLAGLVISLAVSAARGQLMTTNIADLIISGVLSMCVISAVMIGIVVPARLKFGSEKSRLVLFVAFALIAGGAVAVTQSGSFLPQGIAQSISSIAAFMNSYAGLAAGILVMVILILISERISEKVMEQKEY